MTNQNKPEVRPVFIYLTIVAVILGFIGILNMTGHLPALAIFSGKTYTQQEVSKHNTRGNCWISIDNKVYDITLFLQSYEKNVSDKCGKQVSENELAKMGKQLLDEEYVIGNLG